MPQGFDWTTFALDAINHGLRIALILALVVFGRRLARRVIPKTVRLAMRIEVGNQHGSENGEQLKRLDTLTRVFLTTTEVALVVFGGLIILAELGIPIAPLLAGAGIAGVALGFGAQSLVKDILSGLFILIENQYGKGDVVQIAGVGGIVEDVNLRRTVLRDLDGVVHNVPNGEIRIASNMTRGWSRVNLDVRVGYYEDIDRVRAILNQVGAELAADPDWGDVILEAPKVLRVDALEESAVILKILATTKPIKQWDVAGELRRRIKIAFDAEGIRIPYPHHVVLEHNALVETDRADADKGSSASTVSGRSRR